MDIYLKMKMNNDQKKINLHKSLLFIMAEIDRVFEQKMFSLLAIIQVIVRRVSRKVSKDALYRIYEFVRNKSHELKDVK